MLQQPSQTDSQARQTAKPDRQTASQARQTDSQARQFPRSEEAPSNWTWCSQHMRASSGHYAANRYATHAWGAVCENADATSSSRACTSNCPLRSTAFCRLANCISAHPFLRCRIPPPPPFSSLSFLPLPTRPLRAVQLHIFSFVSTFVSICCFALPPVFATSVRQPEESRTLPSFVSTSKPLALSLLLSLSLLLFGPCTLVGKWYGRQTCLSTPSSGTVQGLRTSHIQGGLLPVPRSLQQQKKKCHTGEDGRIHASQQRETGCEGRGSCSERGSSDKTKQSQQAFPLRAKTDSTILSLPAQRFPHQHLSYMKLTTLLMCVSQLERPPQSLHAPCLHGRMGAPVPLHRHSAPFRFLPLLLLLWVTRSHHAFLFYSSPLRTLRSDP